MLSAKERRKQIKEQIQQRHEEAYKRKDDSGKFRSIFEQRLPVEKRCKCGEGDHSYDFIPYVAGPNDPNTKEGKFAYCLDLFVHRKVGVNEDDYLCLNRNHMGKCPICDYQIKLQKEGEVDEAIIKALNPTRRAIYNVWSHDNSKEEAKGVQIWDVSQWAFDSNLSEQAKKKKGGGFIPFADPDDGKIVSFRRTGMGVTNTKYVAFSFEDRDEPIPDEIMDQAMCLDKLIYVPTYEEVAEVFFGEQKEPEKEEKESPRSSRREPEPEEKEEKEPLKRKAREPEPKKEKDVPEEKGNPCPEDFDFGKDFGDFDECDDCEMKKDCRAEKRKERKEPEPEKEPESPPTRRRRG